MNDPQAAQRAEDPSGPRAGRLLVLVPSHLPSRVGYFTGLLARSGIEIIIERRRAERRRSVGQARRRPVSRGSSWPT
jgi:hypothetical protein